MPYYSSTMAGDVWSQWFTCCITQQPPQRRKRRQIDRSMIGEPTNFVHTGHIGSNDVAIGNNQLMMMENQLRSKGGYDYALPHDHRISVGNVERIKLQTSSLDAPLTMPEASGDGTWILQYLNKLPVEL